jgi:integrase
VARRRRLIPENPARGVDKLPEGKQRRFLRLEEIGQLSAAMREAEEEGSENLIGLTAIRFLLLTGLRRMKGLALPWEWVDKRSRCIRFEDTKIGAQLRPMGSAALLLLEAVPRSEGSRFVFPADRGEGHFIACRECWRARAGAQASRG